MGKILQWLGLGIFSGAVILGGLLQVALMLAGIVFFIVNGQWLGLVLWMLFGLPIMVFLTDVLKFLVGGLGMVLFKLGGGDVHDTVR